MPGAWLSSTPRGLPVAVSVCWRLTGATLGDSAHGVERRFGVAVTPPVAPRSVEKPQPAPTGEVRCHREHVVGALANRAVVVSVQDRSQKHGELAVFGEVLDTVDAFAIEFVGPGAVPPHHRAEVSSTSATASCSSVTPWRSSVSCGRYIRP